MMTAKAAMNIEEAVCLYAIKNYNINHKTMQKLMSQMRLKAKQKKHHYHFYKGLIGNNTRHIQWGDNNNTLSRSPNLKMVTDMLK